MYRQDSSDKRDRSSRHTYLPSRQVFLFLSHRAIDQPRSHGYGETLLRDRQRTPSSRLVSHPRIPSLRTKAYSHHEDHIGGLRAYIREGATVVTTPGNLRFIEMLMKKLKATDPQVKLPDVEVIADKRRFSDGMVTLDLLNVSCPHVDEMVVPFVPSDGIAYVADGLTRDFGPWRRPTTEERTLVSQFKKLGLDIRTVLPGHGPASTEKDLEQYLSLVESSSRLRQTP